MAGGISAVRRCPAPPPHNWCHGRSKHSGKADAGHLHHLLMPVPPVCPPPCPPASPSPAGLSTKDSRVNRTAHAGPQPCPPDRAPAPSVSQTGLFLGGGAAFSRCLSRDLWKTGPPAASRPAPVPSARHSFSPEAPPVPMPRALAACLGSLSSKVLPAARIAVKACLLKKMPVPGLDPWVTPPPPRPDDTPCAAPAGGFRSGPVWKGSRPCRRRGTRRGRCRGRLR
ncbi:MAG: hypothetical protein JWM59_1127 [Verrucomicrobiales bacterium]|nr:hypothetical protein [Verrucomicrobiales bacterium]